MMHVPTALFSGRRTLTAAAFVAAFLIAGGVSVAGEYEATGDSLYEAFDYQGSIDAYRQALSSDSGDYLLWFKLGRSLNRYGELLPPEEQLPVYESADSALTRSIELKGDYADSHFELARAAGRIALYKGVFNSIGLAKKVKREVDRAIELDPQHDGAYHILGRWHREASAKPKLIRIPLGLGEANKEDAVKYLKKAVELNPEHINHHLELGITYMAVDDYPRARNEFYWVRSLPVTEPIEEKYKAEAESLLVVVQEKR